MSDVFLTHYEITVGGLGLVRSCFIAFKLSVAQKHFVTVALMVMP
jgi:hypothetical protein